MSHPAPTLESGASNPTRNVRGVSPTRTSSPGLDHPSYPADNHRQVIVHSPRLIEIVPIPVAELRRQQLARNRDARLRREEEAYYARATRVSIPKRSKHRGKGRRRHQRD